MKKRSEIKKRSEVTNATTTKATVPSASERTIEMFDAETRKRGVVHCTGCDEDIEITRIENYRPSDKTAECPECGCSISAAQMNDADRVVIDENGDDVLESEAMARDEIEYSEAAVFCAECGSEWPTVKGKPWPNCGHKNDGVDDPRKARKLAPPAGLQTRTQAAVDRRDAEDAKRKDEPRPGGGSRATMPVDVQKEASTKSASPLAPTMTVERVNAEQMKLSIEWGKSTFPVAPYQNFTVGSFFVSRTVPHDASVLDEGRKILEELRQLADDAFESQADWYAEKLGKLTK